jgi:hypothetical protein
VYCTCVRCAAMIKVSVFPPSCPRAPANAKLVTEAIPRKRLAITALYPPPIALFERGGKSPRTRLRSVGRPWNTERRIGHSKEIGDSKFVCVCVCVCVCILPSVRRALGCASVSAARSVCVRMRQRRVRERSVRYKCLHPLELQVEREVVPPAPDHYTNHV